MDEYLFSEGTVQRLWHQLGAHVMQHEGVAGTHFAVWAPNAARVSVAGDFNAFSYSDEQAQNNRGENRGDRHVAQQPVNEAATVRQ